MTRKITSFVLAVLCGSAVVGVGFASWTFSTSSRRDLNNNVFITQAALSGEFTDLVAPSYAVLDEGALTNNTTITGVSFYKAPVGGRENFGDKNLRESIILDPDLSISFRTKDAMTADQLASLKFGFRITVKGSIKTYLRMTSTYYSVAEQPAAEIGDGEEAYRDLKDLTSKPSFDGSPNYIETQNSDGTWVLTFKFTTTTLDSFITFNEVWRPTGSKDKYDALVTSVSQALSRNDSSFVLELWQGM